MTRSIVAIGGPHGSGKSSVAEKLAKILGMNYVSAGVLFRTLAKGRNQSLEELSKIATTESQIDINIDESTKKLGNRDNTIIDAQLASHFSPLDTAIRICITASEEVRWQRIAKRDNISLEKAKKETDVREDAERNRFLSLYGIDVQDLSSYDIIIRNDRLNESETYKLCESIVTFVLNNLKSREAI